MKTVTIHHAKTNLSRLIEQACRGEEIVITPRSEPVARLVPIADTRRHRQPGMLRGKLRIGPEFFERLPADELAGWE